MSENPTCPSCLTQGMVPFYRQEGVPTNSCILLDSPEEARAYPRGDIELCFCPACGFVSNMSFRPELTEYSGRYEETQGFSETFQRFHRDLAQRLIERYDLRGKDVLEIGCGKGEFITLLSELGGNRGVGFDPSYRPERTTSEVARRQVTFITDFYSEKYKDYKADFVCCKMTLEHIHDTARFVATVREAVGDDPDTVVFFQIPEATRILRECAFEDIYYEHCSYFTPGSLARLFRRSGFDVMRLDVEYGGQYLTIEARPRTGAAAAPLPQEDDLETVAALVADFPRRFKEKKRLWEARLQGWAARDRKVVLWGSGSKGVAFLSTLDPQGRIRYAVDINPYRHGYYMPGGGQEIVAPEFLKDYRPDVVVVMNAIYCEEIGRDLEALGLCPEMVAL